MTGDLTSSGLIVAIAGMVMSIKRRACKYHESVRLVKALLKRKIDGQIEWDWVNVPGTGIHYFWD